MTGATQLNPVIVFSYELARDRVISGNLVLAGDTVRNVSHDGDESDALQWSRVQHELVQI